MKKFDLGIGELSSTFQGLPCNGYMLEIKLSSEKGSVGSKIRNAGNLAHGDVDQDTHQPKCGK